MKKLVASLFIIQAVYWAPPVSSFNVVDAATLDTTQTQQCQAR